MTGHRFTTLVAAALGGFLWLYNGFAAEQPPSANLRPMSYADLERLYLDGKISAKQYQKYLNDLKSHAVEPGPVQSTNPATTPPAPTTQAQPPPTATIPPTATPPPSKNDQQINAVEAKMDELLKAKA